MRKSHIIIAIIFLITLSMRLMLAFSTDSFLDDSSYFIARQVEHISENKIPLFEDYLSYSGRTYIFSPIYHYLLSIFSIVLPYEILYKLIPNLFASLMVIVVFIITKSITKSDMISLFTAGTSVFIPIFVKNTYNSLNPISFVLLLTFLSMYYFINIKTKFSTFISLVVILALFSPLVIVLILGFLIYLLLSKLTGIKNPSEEKEIILFSTFFSLWFQFLLYKNAFLLHSIKVIWQNMPLEFLNNQFSQFSIPLAIYQIGFIIFLCGIYVLYNNLFSEKDRKINLFFSMALSSIILLWFKLIPFRIGLMFLGFIFIILFGYFLFTFFSFLNKVHFNKYNILMVFIISLLIIFSSVIPTVIETYLSFNDAPDASDIEMFKWMNQNIPEDSIAVVPIVQAHTFTYFSEKKNVMDDHFLLITDVEERKRSIDEIYKTSFTNNAIRDLNKYGAGYVVLTNEAKSIYGINKLGYSENNCFKMLNNISGVELYQSLCTLEEK